MIKKLYVSNYALIDRLEMEPSPGMTILTGETGAGKSIILGALGLATGARADLAALRDNTRKCVVELSVEIDGMGLEGFFAENDLDYEPLTILRREILPSGKSRAFVNDTPVLLDTLGRLAAHLLDVHSQHQSLLLSRPAFRLGLVDRYAGNDVPRTQYRQRYEQYRALQKELEELSARRRELARTQDYNRYLLDELDKSDLKDPGEQDELESLVARLSHSQQVKEDLQAAWQQMDAEETGVLSRLAETLSLLRRAEAYLPPQDQLTVRTESALIELKDITERVCSLVEESEDDPQLLQRATERLDLLYTLLRKHNAKDLSALIALRESLRGEVSGLEQLDERIDNLQQECAQAEQARAAASSVLTQTRREAAAALSEQITDTVRSLGMPHATFRIEVSSSDTFTAEGADSVRFLFSANLGQAPADVEKIASGGELSRVMLAVKYALARRAKLPSILFDEIDTGVSGEISDRMGSIMQDMSRHMQVIAITHLPQIASRGDLQYKVFKQESEGTTRSRIALLSPEERTAELARMISGANITEAAMEHARELLRQNAKN